MIVIFKNWDIAGFHQVCDLIINWKWCYPRESMVMKAQRIRIQNAQECILDTACDHFQLLEAVMPLITLRKQISNYEKKVRCFLVIFIGDLLNLILNWNLVSARNIFLIKFTKFVPLVFIDIHIPLNYSFLIFQYLKVIRKMHFCCIS